MQDKIEFFRFEVYGDAWGEIEENGNLVFQNQKDIVKPNNVLSDLIFLHLANKDLTKLENYFLEQGFLGFPAELIDSKVPVTSIGVSKKPDYSVTHFTQEEALEYINKCFENQKTLGMKL